MKKRIALLLCIEASEELAKRHGDYPAMFKSFLKEEQNNYEIVIYDVFRKNELPDLEKKKEHERDNIDDFSAIVISGSKWSANDPDPWIGLLVDWIKKYYCAPDSLVSFRIPLIGICFGHQIICRAFGAGIGTLSKGWELGYTKLEVANSEKIEYLFGQQKTLAIQSLHKEEAIAIPKGFTLLASSPNCKIQGLVNWEKRILTLQGHPEVMPGYIRDFASLRYADGVITKDVFDHVMNTKDNPTDAELFSNAIQKFINNNSQQ